MRYFIVDAFAKDAFTGNPAAVVLVDRKLTDSEYLKYAAEFNLSETCFVELENENTDFKTETSFLLRKGLEFLFDLNTAFGALQKFTYIDP